MLIVPQVEGIRVKKWQTAECWIVFKKKRWNKKSKCPPYTLDPLYYLNLIVNGSNSIHGNTTLKPVGHQSTNWIVLLVLMVAMAALTSLGTTSPLYNMQQAMYLPWRGSHLTIWLAGSKHALVISATLSCSWLVMGRKSVSIYEIAWYFHIGEYSAKY